MKKIVLNFFMVLLLGSMLCSCSNSKLHTKSVADMKEYLIQNDFYDEKNFQSYELEGISTFAGLMKNDWTFLFYNYGDDKEALDNIIPVMLSGIELTSETQKSNYKIYERDATPNYCLCVRVDNTFLMLVGPKDSKQEIRELAKDLGYYTE